MGCPSLNKLMDFARQRVTPYEREEIMTHLAIGCRHCQEDQVWLSKVERLTALDMSFEFPEQAISTVVGWMLPLPQAVKRPLRQLTAQLIFDSLMPRQLAGVRSGAAISDSSSRQMLYHADGYDIDLRFEQTEDGEAEELIGQILPEDEHPEEAAEFTVCLTRDQIEAGNTKTDARLVFKFTRISTGVYDLKIEAQGVEINISRASSAGAS